VIPYKKNIQSWLIQNGLPSGILNGSLYAQLLPMMVGDCLLSIREFR